MSMLSLQSFCVIDSVILVISHVSASLTLSDIYVTYLKRSRILVLDTKEVTRSHKSKDRHIQWPKKTNNSLQNTTQKTKDRASRTPLKTWVELWCSKSESSSCTTSWHVASVMLLLFCSKTGDSFFVFLEKPLHAVCLIWVKEQVSEKGSRVGTHRNVDFLLKNTKQSAYDIHKDTVASHVPLKLNTLACENSLIISFAIMIWNSICMEKRPLFFGIKCLSS